MSLSRCPRLFCLIAILIHFTQRIPLHAENGSHGPRSGHGIAGTPMEITTRIKADSHFEVRVNDQTFRLVPLRGAATVKSTLDGLDGDADYDIQGVADGGTLFVSSIRKRTVRQEIGSSENDIHGNPGLIFQNKLYRWEDGYLVVYEYKSKTPLDLSNPEKNCIKKTKIKRQDALPSLLRDIEVLLKARRIDKPSETELKRFKEVKTTSETELPVIAGSIRSEVLHLQTAAQHQLAANRKMEMAKSAHLANTNDGALEAAHVKATGDAGDAAREFIRLTDLISSLRQKQDELVANLQKAEVTIPKLEKAQVAYRVEEDKELKKKLGANPPVSLKTDENYRHFFKRLKTIEDEKSRYGVMESYPSFSRNFEFVSIGHGSFSMGADPTESGRQSNEVRHAVILTEDYEIQSIEVSQELWKDIMGTNPSRYDNDLTRPVENVSWFDISGGFRDSDGNWLSRIDYDALEPEQKANYIYREGFLDKLNEKRRTLGDTCVYRLPTEAEWEFAARGANQVSEAEMRMPFLTGNNTDGLSNFSSYARSSQRGTTPVGYRDAGRLGLRDIHGNVFEWTGDSYDRDYENLPRENPVSLGGRYRVLKGGSWASGRISVRFAYRGKFPPHRSDSETGFRLVRTCASSR